MAETARHPDNAGSRLDGTGAESFAVSLWGDRGRDGEIAERSAFRDLVFYESSITPGVRLAALVTKPVAPGPILVNTHGWHGGIPRFQALHEAHTCPPYLYVEVDMRGRTYSSGSADANGYELVDVADAIAVVRNLYADWITDGEIVFFEGSSGGGGNALALAGKFPDLFSAITAKCPISDYAAWYDGDQRGEFRDELTPWLGGAPRDRETAYRSRSGLELVANVQTPLLLIHGETDERVPSTHSRRYREAAAAAGKDALVEYVELPGVGTRTHWGNATSEQMMALGRAGEQHRGAHPQPPRLPRQGRVVVAGYVVTRELAIVLDSVDDLVTVDYDLDAHTLELLDREARLRCVVWRDQAVEPR